MDAAAKLLVVTSSALVSAAANLWQRVILVYRQKECGVGESGQLHAT